MRRWVRINSEMRGGRVDWSSLKLHADVSCPASDLVLLSAHSRIFLHSPVKYYSERNTAHYHPKGVCLQLRMIILLVFIS